MTLTWTALAKARMDGMGWPAVSSPLMILALIWDVICS